MPIEKSLIVVQGYKNTKSFCKCRSEIINLKYFFLLHQMSGHESVVEQKKISNIRQRAKNAQNLVNSSVNNSSKFSTKKKVTFVQEREEIKNNHKRTDKTYSHFTSLRRCDQISIINIYLRQISLLKNKQNSNKITQNRCRINPICDG